MERAEFDLDIENRTDAEQEITDNERVLVDNCADILSRLSDKIKSIKTRNDVYKIGEFLEAVDTIIEEVEVDTFSQMKVAYELIDNALKR